MKPIITFLFVFTFIFNVNAGNSKITKSKALLENSYQIGDFIEGGIVFWVDETGEHGLVCSKQDQDNGIQWAPQRNKRNYDKRIAGVHSTSTSIFGNKDKNHEGRKRVYAKKLCKKLKSTEGGEEYSDWELPNKDELNKIYLNKDIINKTAIDNNGSALSEGYYWSSTEEDRHNSWIQYFKTGKQSYYFKHYFYNIRAVRAF